MSVHNNEDEQNLLNLLIESGFGEKMYPVHRLDKETSGIQLIALNQKMAKELSEEFQEKRVKKTYVGILRGQLKRSVGVWDRTLTDKAEGRKNPGGTTSGRVDCETGYKVVRSSKYFSQCEFDLVTGRQHQIRKHAALANHGLVGDPRYGDRKYNKKIASLYGTERMFLHCTKINILSMNFESSIPKEFQKLFF